MAIEACHQKQGRFSKRGPLEAVSACIAWSSRSSEVISGLGGGGAGSLSEFPQLMCNSPSILHLCTVSSFDLDFDKLRNKFYSLQFHHHIAMQLQVIHKDVNIVIVTVN